MNKHRETAYALLRVTLGVIFLFYGIGKFMGGVGLFADGMNQRFAGKMIAIARYRIDASQSRFMVRAFSGGLLWFKGHDHFIKIGDFSGQIQFTPSLIAAASLELRVRADSLEETRDVFTPQQKGIINKELREIVLETSKYPEIVFKSTDVTGRLAASQYEAKIGGDLTLHGVTRHIVIPAQVTLDGGGLRARGEFTVNRGDYNVKATSAAKGTVRVRDKLKFTFDIVAHPI
ncbi:MAG TPA: YceI family protein [Pyrinomonadaceae bacterium]|nr:YceI family protein [Pyrinomonadaceae bacterium]